MAAEDEEGPVPAVSLSTLVREGEKETSGAVRGWVGAKYLARGQVEVFILEGGQFSVFTQTQDVLKATRGLYVHFHSGVCPRDVGGGGLAVGGWQRRDDSLQLISF